ncbi:carbohydrate binding domain-containing protein [Sphingomonas sp. LM7]|uniref:carbohydrate binding domain-containing protein n=1 Tax=Sphingomonas sp. LM7 TaxID=1938607 RepID=UPI000983DFCC|nr:carbohydrate binding domain-containing protein [Sphingomonas sp. LM7]AQR75027.1 hypothetical protein BXU08_16395 [Sphingomonas sp. LM7]
MNLRIAIALGAALPALFAVPGIAQDAQSSEDALAEKVVTNPNPASFQAYGVTPPPKVVSDKNVQGGKALRVPVTGGGDPWSVGVNVPLIKPVKTGDKLVVVFYARLSKGDAPAAKINAQLQLSSAPYTALFGKPFDVTPEWKLLQFSGKVDKDYGVGAIGAALHLNTGRQVIDIGPVAVLDMGQ